MQGRNYFRRDSINWTKREAPAKHEDIVTGTETWKDIDLIQQRFVESARLECSSQKRRSLANKLIEYVNLNGGFDRFLLSPEITYNFTLSKTVSINKGEAYNNGLICQETDNSPSNSTYEVCLYGCNYCNKADFTEASIDSHRITEHFDEMEFDARAPTNPLFVLNLRTDLYYCFKCGKNIHVAGFSFHQRFCYKKYLSASYNSVVNAKIFCSRPSLIRARRKTRAGYHGQNKIATGGERDYASERIQKLTRGKKSISRSNRSKSIIANFDQLQPNYASEQVNDFHELYGDHPDNSYFCIYVVFERSKLPEDLSTVTFEQADRAAIYVGSGYFTRPIEAILRAFSDNYKVERVNLAYQKIFKTNGSFLIVRLPKFRKRAGAFAAEGSVLQFLGLGDVNSNLLNSYLVSQKYYPRHWYWKDIEDFGAVNFRTIIYEMKNGQLVETSYLTAIKRDLGLTLKTRGSSANYVTKGNNDYSRSKHSKALFSKLENSENIDWTSELKDFTSIYGKSSSNGFFIVYAIFNRSNLPTDLDSATFAQIENATIYLGSGLFIRPLSSIKKITKLGFASGEGTRKVNGYKEIIENDDGFLVCTLGIFDDRKAAFSAEGSIIQFYGINKNSNLLNAKLCTPEYYPKSWKARSIENFGSYWFVKTKDALKHGQLIKNCDIENFIHLDDDDEFTI